MKELLQRLAAATGAQSADAGRSSAAKALELSIRSGQKEVARLDPPPAPGPGRWESASRPASGSKRLEQQHRPQPHAGEPNGWRPGAGRTPIRPLLIRSKAAEGGFYGCAGDQAKSPGGGAELTVRLRACCGGGA